MFNVKLASSALRTSLKKKPQNLGERVDRLLDDLVNEGLYPKTLTFSGTTTEPISTLKGKRVIMFGSNNYLGLANRPELIRAAKEQLDIHGMGPGGSRSLTGNIDYIEKFEERLAKFVGVEEVITFPTGYMANLSIFQAIMGPSLTIAPNLKNSGGVILSDEYNHATIVDGCRLSSAKKELFKHNSLNDLKQRIKKTKNQQKLIVTESIFSVEGLQTDIPSYIQLARETGSLIMVDDAHGIGVLGRNGGGVIQEYELKGLNKPDIIMASFDKAMGTIGGYIGGSSKLIKYLRVGARSYMFSSTIPVAVAAATWAGMDYIESHPQVIQRARSNAEYLRTEFKRMNLKVLGNTVTPVVPLFVGSDQIGKKVSEEAADLGVYIPCFRFPAAPMNQSRLRISVMATHQKEHLDKLLEVISKISNKYKLPNASN